MSDEIVRSGDRETQYLAYAAGEAAAPPDFPRNYKEQLLLKIAESGGGGGGGGGNLPAGGTAGQFLVKQSATNYDAAWVTVPSAQGVSF